MYNQSLSPIQQVDFALFLIFAFGAVVLISLTILTGIFIYKYRHTRHPQAVDIKGNVIAESLWTLVPIMIVMGLFYFGWTGYKALRTVPPNAMKVQVTAKMFSWMFTYENGKKSPYLAVPVGKPVRLDIMSTDVIHSFYSPAFRIKMDAVPGMSTYAWFKAEKEGEYEIYCAEYCGLNHSTMLSTIKAMPRDSFKRWYEDIGPKKGAQAGYAIMESQGCFACHSTDGSTDMGAPSFKGLAGSKETLITKEGKEQSVIVDDDYLKDSITNPGKTLVKGYDNMMPPYSLSEEEMSVVLEFFHSIKGEATSSHDQPSDTTPNNHSHNSTDKVAPPVQ